MGKEQVSGSITLDAGALAAAMVRQLEPVLERVNSNVAVVAGLVSHSAVLNRERMAEVINAHAGEVMSGDDAREIAETLDLAGYALIAVGGDALASVLAESGYVLEPIMPRPELDWLDRKADWLDRKAD